MDNFKNTKNAVGNKIKKQIVVAVSGGFDPLHAGHVRLFKDAKKLGDKLFIILNNDNWLMYKKGFVFMKEKERKEIIESLSSVDKVVLTSHSSNSKDISICKELKKIKPDIFANGGDRTKKNIPEVATCKKINCKMVFNIGHGGKIQSSSDLVKKQKSKFEFLIYQNYLEMIKASENSEMFRHVYVLNNNKKKDILENGELSCAYYVSCILKIFNLIDSKISPHSTVGGTIKNMLDNDWKVTKKLTAGNILIWEDGLGTDKKMHSHLGFYLGKNRAISNQPKVEVKILRDGNEISLNNGGEGVPMIHHYTYNNKRKIIQILTHKMIKK